jgi:hypothetical protein
LFQNAATLYPFYLFQNATTLGIPWRASISQPIAPEPQS